MLEAMVAQWMPTEGQNRTARRIWRAAGFTYCGALQVKIATRDASGVQQAFATLSAASTEGPGPNLPSTAASYSALRVSYTGSDSRFYRLLQTQVLNNFQNNPSKLWQGLDVFRVQFVNVASPLLARHTLRPVQSQGSFFWVQGLTSHTHKHTHQAHTSDTHAHKTHTHTSDTHAHTHTHAHTNTHTQATHTHTQTHRAPTQKGRRDVTF